MIYLIPFKKIPSFFIFMLEHCLSPYSFSLGGKEQHENSSKYLLLRSTV